MYGFFYMAMGSAQENLAIETDCVAAVPSYTKPNSAADIVDTIIDDVVDIVDEIFTQ